MILYLAGFTGRWRIEPDAALYLSVARNIAEGNGFTYQGRPHNLAYPGLPWMIAGTFKVFGTDVLWPAHVLMLLITLATLALTYRTFRLHADTGIATIVTLGTGLTYTFYPLAHRIMTDMPFLLGVMAFFCGYEAMIQRSRDPSHVCAGKWTDWTLMILGLAIAMVMRPTAWVLLPVVIVIMLAPLLRRGAKSSARWIGILLLLLIVAGTISVIVWRSRGTVTTAAGSYEEFVFNLAIHRPGQLLHQIFFERLPHLLDEIMVTGSFALDLPVGTNIPLAIVLIVLGMALVRQRLAWGLWVAAMIGIMLAVVAVDRYVVSILPFLVYAWWRGMAWVNRRLPHPWGDWAFAVLLAMSTIPNTVKTCGVIIEQRRPNFYAHYKDGRYAALMTMAGHISRHVGEADVVLSRQNQARVLSYLSRRRVVGTLEPVQIHLHEQPVFVVMDPEDPDLRAWIDRLGLTLSEPIETIERRKQSLTLHRATIRDPGS
jgi:hypothetical protein